MIRIGEFSKLCKTTIKALRYYDEIGLLKPVKISKDNGYRYYDSTQLSTVSRILLLKNMGFTLDEIVCIIKEKIEGEKLYEMLSIKQKEVTRNILLEQEKLDKIIAYIRGIEEAFKMSEVVIKNLPEVIVASMRKVIHTYDELNQLAPMMGEKMNEHGAVCRDPFYCFNIYHDGEYKETDIDVEICEAVIDYCKDADDIIYKKIEEVKEAACIYHKGPYETLGDSYGKIFRWIFENGYKTVDMPRESYIDGCWNKEDQAEWLTEIQVPIDKR